MGDPITSKGWPFLNVTADALVKTGRGVLHSVVLNGCTVVGDIVIYDGIDAGGTVIATLNVRSAVHVSFQPIPFIYDCEITTGIFVDISSSTFAGNITVMYK